MAKSIDFATLDLRDALDLASLIEEEAYERYVEFARQMDQQHTPGAAGFFRTMSGYEAKHGSELAERRAKLFPDQPRRVTREMLWDAEAPGYENVEAFMTPREAMDVALAAEVKAQLFFASAIPNVKDAQVKALFVTLYEEELHHQELVQAQIAMLPPDPDADVTDYEDEPVAQ